MQKDYKPSTKYTADDFQNLQVPYKYRDLCKDQYAQYLVCSKTNPLIFENVLVYNLPLLGRMGKCGVLRDQWTSCQEYREKELFEDLKNIFEAQKKNA